MHSPREVFEIIRSHPSPGRFVASRVLRKAGLSEHVTFEVNHGLRLRLYPSHLTETYWQVRDAREEDHRILRAFLSEGDTYVDVGANIGALAIHAASLVTGTGSVEAIEAHPRTYSQLLGNIRLNGCSNIETLNVAVGDGVGTLKFTDERSDDLNRVAEDGIEVQVAPLDDIVGGRHVKLLKVDVEGYELFVFEGAAKTLRATQVIYFESSDLCRRYGHERRDVTDLLRRQGFEVFRHDSTDWVMTERDYVGTQHEDLIAMRDPGLLRTLTR